MIEVVCATLGQRQPLGLEHIPGDHRLLTDSRPGWATAVNALLDASTGDVLHIDDDIELTPDSLDFLSVPRVFESADVFGFKLFTGAGAIHSAGFHVKPDGQLEPQRSLLDISRAGYVAHCTASALYIKRHVIEAGVRFPVWGGQHYEDVAFTFDCWLRGFRVAYVPAAVIHHINLEVGAGATKATLPTFNADRAVNNDALREWVKGRDVKGAVARGVIPTGWRGLV